MIWSRFGDGTMREMIVISRAIVTLVVVIRLLEFVLVELERRAKVC